MNARYEPVTMVQMLRSAKSGARPKGVPLAYQPGSRRPAGGADLVAWKARRAELRASVWSDLRRQANAAELTIE